MKCQTAYLYVLMSNNDQVAANQPMSVVLDVCCLLSTYTRTAAMKGSQGHLIRWQTQNKGSSRRPVMKIRPISSVYLQRKVKPADRSRLSEVYEWAGDDRKVLGNVTDHSPYRPVGTRQTNPAASPDDGFNVTRMWGCLAADIFRSVIWGEWALHSHTLFTKGTSCDFFFFFLLPWNRLQPPPAWCLDLWPGNSPLE